jgi:hypothetical protein
MRPEEVINHTGLRIATLKMTTRSFAKVSPEFHPFAEELMVKIRTNFNQLRIMEGKQWSAKITIGSLLDNVPWEKFVNTLPAHTWHLNMMSTT